MEQLVQDCGAILAACEAREAPFRDSLQRQGVVERLQAIFPTLRHEVT